MIRRGTASRKPANGNGSSFMLVLVLMCALITFGILFTIIMAPHVEFQSGLNTKSVHNEQQQRSLSQKILDWLPYGLAGHQSLDEQPLFPDWSKEFWSPIDVDVTNDPMITLCRLNFKQYSESPHIYPMFRDLESMSRCQGSNKRREFLSVLMKEIKDKAGTPEGRIVAPTAFVFHESRVGSTLVANTLASDPFSMVFSESAPAANALLHCRTCSTARNVEIFRDVITLMGRSPVHRHLFFKFQSITATKMHIALQAFPETPWAFIYRQPIQTMMSHLDPLKGSGSGAPCLRSMRDPPPEVKNSIQLAGVSSNTPKEAWCAAHLNMLCNNAIRAYKEYGMYNDSQQRGFLVNYESLPGSIPRVLLPSFGVEPSDYWLSKMAVESKSYSKGRNVPKLFFGDSEDKEGRATAAIQQFSNSILQSSYEEMAAISTAALKSLSSTLFEKIVIKSASGATLDINWKSLKDIPVAATYSVPLSSRHRKVDPLIADGMKRSLDGTDSLRGRHSSSFKAKEYLSWAPFSNTHNSKPVQRVECPPIPAPGYPIAYNMMNILGNWNTDSTEIPPFHYDSICHFDHQNETELAIAKAYRVAEVPFIVYNIPQVDEVVKKWNNVDYLQKQLGKKTYRTETSKDNHFMYWHASLPFSLPGGKKWEAPTGLVQITFEDWLETAVRGQNKSLGDRTHQYFRVSSDVNNDWLFNELPFFQPKPSLMIVDPKEQRGIHCRFGMRNVIAEAHFDGSRNSIVMLGGMRRWILAHPDQCENMHMLPRNHPSARHSAVDWSKPDLDAFPNFAKVVGNEVILQPGDFLYIPTYWHHYIVSLNVNFQCNTRSGRTTSFDKYITKCGF